MHNNSTKRARQAALLEAVRREAPATQADLVRALRRRGIPATQVSVSRDIAELGLVKASGRYREGLPSPAAADPELPLRLWLKSARPAGPHLVVLRCDTGAAQRVGLALDRMALTGVVGTVAGDDTVFVAAASGADSARLLRFLDSRAAGSGAS